MAIRLPIFSFYFLYLQFLLQGLFKFLLSEQLLTLVYEPHAPLHLHRIFISTLNLSIFNSPMPPLPPLLLFIIVLFLLDLNLSLKILDFFLLFDRLLKLSQLFFNTSLNIVAIINILVVLKKNIFFESIYGLFFSYQPLQRFFIYLTQRLFLFDFSEG